MAINIVAIRTGVYSGEWSITWTADADTDAVINHGLQGTPNVVTITPLNVTAYVGQPVQGALSPTTATISKNAAVASGGASVRVALQFIHSIQR